MHRRDLLRAVARKTGDQIRTIKRLGFHLITEPPAEQAANRQWFVSSNKIADTPVLMDGSLPESSVCMQ